MPALIEAGEHVAAHRTADVRSAMGVNSRADLMELEEIAQRDIIRRHADAGVTFEAPASIRVEVDVEIGARHDDRPGHDPRRRARRSAATA